MLLRENIYAVNTITTSRLLLPRSVPRSVILLGKAWQFILSLSKDRTLVRLVILFGILCVSHNIHAQLNTDNAYTMSLKDVLTDIQKRYGVQIKYPDSMVANKKVPYAEWRYRNDVET